MQLINGDFEGWIAYFQGRYKLVYDNNAMLFPGENGTDHPIFNEPLLKGHDKRILFKCYDLYARIDGLTLPVDRGLIDSIKNTDKIIEVPFGTKLSHYYTNGIAYNFNKPLEVLAYFIESREKKLITNKWQIILLRPVGEQIGYINNYFL